MWQDPIVAETRALRYEYARQFNYDIDAIFADLVAKQAMLPERLVSFPPRKPSVESIIKTKINW
jgi:hypothetical protein